jgi:two-component system, sensor histidine kinase RegB
MYGLENLIDNAVDFAATTVTIAASWTELDVRITISDDGPGFATEVLKRLGEPYVTTRKFDSRAESDSTGLGLGLFIAKTLLERGGAQFSAANRPLPDRGAEIVLVWRRETFMAEPAAKQQDLTDDPALRHPVHAL